MADSWINRVSAAALARFDEVMGWLDLEGGKRQGREYLPLNPNRADHKPGSFSINVDTGAWMDGASGDKGGDLVALAAFVLHLKQADAGRGLAGFLGIAVPPPREGAGKGHSGGGDTRPSTSPSKPAQAPAKAKAEAAGVCVMPIPDDAPPPPASHSRHGKPAGRWAYTDAAGRVCFYHDRYEPKGERKQFAPLTLWRLPDGRLAWQFKAPPEPRPILGAADLAKRPTAPVVVVEGEKARDAVLQLLPDHVPVCWQGGAQAVEKADWRPLAGRLVVLWPDADTPGGECMAKLGRLLQRLGAAQVQAVNLSALAQAPGRDDAGKPTLSPAAPLEQGDDAADLLARGWQADHLALVWNKPGTLQAMEKPTTPARKGAAGQDGQAPTLPPRRFELGDGGVYLIEPEKSPRRVCGRLEALAMVRDPHNRGWGLLVAFQDPDGQPHREIIPARAFKGDGLEVAELLLDGGLTIAPKCRPLLVEYLQTARPEARARVTNRTGWHDTQGGGSVFVLPTGAYGQGGEEWIFESESPGAVTFKQKGGLPGWQREVAARCVGNSRLVFAVSMAFASPVLHLVGAESGGFHLRSNSSDGKTTCLRVAASVCGGADYMQRWRATDNGLEALAMNHCDGPLLLDELAQLDPKAAGEVAYMLANGTGKARASRNGGMREQSRWRLLFLSAGEIGLAQHMAEAGKQARAGQELRLAEIPADAGAGLGVFENLHDAPGGAAFAKALDVAVRGYHGAAWVAFLDRLTQEQDSVADTLHQAQKAFEGRFLSQDAGGQAHRVAARFALVGAAGELATAWGITGWPEGEAMKAAGVCFQAWVSGRGGEGNQEERAILSQVREQLRRYGESAFTDWDRPSMKDTHAPVRSDRMGYRRHDEDADEVHYYLFNEAFRSRLCKGFDPGAVGRLLLARGYVESGTEKGRPWLVKTKIPGEGRPRVVHVLPSLWEDDDA